MASVQDAVDRYVSLKQALGRIGDQAAPVSQEALARWASKLIQLVGLRTSAEGPAVGSPQDLQGLIEDLDEALELLPKAVAPAFRQAFQRVDSELTAAIPNLYSGLRGVSVRQLRAAKAALDTAAMPTLASSGLRSWVRDFQARNTNLVAEMQSVLSTGQLNGWNQRRLADEFLSIPEFSNVPVPNMRAYNVGKALTQEEILKRRAFAIAKTQLTATVNAVHLEWTKEAGMDRYINVNDVPESKQCKLANELKPMTREQWAKKPVSEGGGIPPRHPNCDSFLLAVPSSYEGTGQFSEALVGGAA